MNIQQFQAGYRDANGGHYDKWYRYNAKDGGESYENGVKLAIAEGSIINHIIECMHQEYKSMAETIQVHLPAELTPVFEEIREVRAKQFKPTSNKSIVIDAVKDMHKKVTK